MFHQTVQFQSSLYIKYLPLDYNLVIVFKYKYIYWMNQLIVSLSWFIQRSCMSRRLQIVRGTLYELNF